MRSTQFIPGLFFVLLLANSCGLLSGPSDKGISDSLVPLSIGNSWVYQKTNYSVNSPEWSSTDTVNVLVVDTIDVTIQGIDYFTYIIQGF